MTNSTITPLISTAVAESAAWDVLAELQNTCVSHERGTPPERHAMTWLGKIQGALMILLIALRDEQEILKLKAAA